MALHPRIENFWDALLQPIVDSEGLRWSESLHCNSNTSEAVITPQPHRIPIIPLRILSVIFGHCLGSWSAL